MWLHIKVKVHLLYRYEQAQGHLLHAVCPWLIWLNLQVRILLVELLNSYQVNFVTELKNQKTNQTNKEKTNKQTKKALHFHQSMSVLSPEISVLFNQSLKSVPLEWMDQE